MDQFEYLSYPNCFDFVNTVMILSQRNANLNRGFSINPDFSLKTRKKSLIACNLRYHTYGLSVT